jgi:tRNA nucleotidyltransferase (CCA-adding enzyme)
VEPAPIQDDLLRRDFTVNALAFGLLGPSEGEIVAAPRALDDLTHRRLAVLHDQSFVDDPTRLLRLARYAARLRFTVAPETRALAQQAIATGALDTISGNRLGNELRLLAAESDPVAAFQAAADLGLPWRIDPALANRALTALPADARPDRLILALALGGEALEQLNDLGFTAADRDAIIEAATQAPALARRLRTASSSSEIARAVGSAGAGTVALASALGPPDPAQRWLTHLRHLSLEITGADLLAAGVAEGPTLGSALAAARDALLDGHAPDRATQLAVALRAAR